LVPRRTVIGTSLVTEFLQTILLTGRIAKESPVSTFIIAQPEHGKTSVVLESPFACAVDVTDCTGKGLQELLKYKAEMSHVIFNDLTVVAAHSKTVRAYLIAMINAMTEEGIRSIAFPGNVETYQNGKRGIVACSTPDVIKDSRAWFNKIGLSSRVIPFHYCYSEALTIRIKMAINNDSENKPGKSLPVPAALIHVEIPDKLSVEIMKISDAKAKELGDPLGIRRLKQFRRMAKAHALFRGWKNPVCNEEDLDFLKRIYPYVDYKKGCIL
jgi:hypothetical protein